MRPAVDSTAESLHRTRQAGEVLHWMELREIPEAHRGDRREWEAGNSAERLDVGNPGTLRRFDFRLELLPAGFVLREPVAVEPLEIAVDALLTHHLFDPI